MRQVLPESSGVWNLPLASRMPELPTHSDACTLSACWHWLQSVMVSATSIGMVAPPPHKVPASGLTTALTASPNQPPITDGRWRNEMTLPMSSSATSLMYWTALSARSLQVPSLTGSFSIGSGHDTVTRLPLPKFFWYAPSVPM